MRLECCPDERRKLAARFWKEFRLKQKQKLTCRLHALKKHWKGDTFTPTMFRIDGCTTYDRQAWLQGVLDFGRRRFGDPDNGAVHQSRTLESLSSVAKNERLDGRSPASLELWHTLQSRAEFKAGSAAGNDGNTPDIYLDLPFLSVARVHAYFLERSKLNLDSEELPYWKILQFIGLPKTSSTTEFRDLRWICKSFVLQKWYLRSFRPQLRSEIRLSSVHSYGFRRFTSTSQVTGLVRQLQFLADSWNLPLAIGV